MLHASARLTAVLTWLALAIVLVVALLWNSGGAAWSVWQSAVAAIFVAILAALCLWLVREQGR